MDDTDDITFYDDPDDDQPFTFAPPSAASAPDLPDPPPEPIVAGPVGSDPPRGEGQTGEPAPAVREGRPCQAPGCSNRIPVGAGGRRRFCDEHQPGSSKKSQPSTSTFGSPPSKASKADDLAQVERNAKALIEMTAGLMLIISDTTDKPMMKLDAVDVQAGAGRLAASLRNVAQYEDWMRKMLAGGKGSDRAMAWVGLAVTAGAVALPILIRHGMIPAEAMILAGMAAPSQGMAESADQPQAA